MYDNVKHCKEYFTVSNNKFWSENFFSHTMHSKFPVVNVAESSWNAFGKQVSSSVQQSIVTDILEGCAHSFVNYSLF